MVCGNEYLVLDYVLEEDLEDLVFIEVIRNVLGRGVLVLLKSLVVVFFVG